MTGPESTLELCRREQSRLALLDTLSGPTPAREQAKAKWRAISQSAAEQAMLDDAEAKAVLDRMEAKYRPKRVEGSIYLQTVGDEGLAEANYQASFRTGLKQEKEIKTYV